MADIIGKIESVIGNKIVDAKHRYEGGYNELVLVLDDGTTITWGYEDNEGSTTINPNKCPHCGSTVIRETDNGENLYCVGCGKTVEGK